MAIEAGYNILDTSQITVVESRGDPLRNNVVERTAATSADGQSRDTPPIEGYEGLN